ncbi:zinc ABC transporter permease [Corynebacterium phocae]|uniref:Zinc ABC transporter permease n=1 Tax=Corynebacterium phocae TaxID=161895 RepID=A0A1L7D1J9_9CORY|nr:metal ABC transporter permease [Corynebacterium phocae]APT91841.1 zinc ABC transporter permease [Corynebacterium phocae]KAA8727450.1 metal ABC transporter permease [Corynebacterium phocae]
MTLATSICLLAIATALACAIPGVFVVLKGDSMLIDGLGHAVLPGIAVGYMFTHDLSSPWLIVTAALGALAVGLGTQRIAQSGLIPRDAALGIIYPALFAAGVLLISEKFAHVHLDVHAVLVGDLNLVALSSPEYILYLGGIALFNFIFVMVCLPRLTTSTFDNKLLAAPKLHLLFHAAVAVTATAAFQTAGAMLVIALMVLPAVIARLLTRRVLPMLLVAMLVAIVGSILGFWGAYHANAATSAAMTVVYALLFIPAVLWYKFARS